MKNSGVVVQLINVEKRCFWLLFGLFSVLYFLTYIQANNDLWCYAIRDDALFYKLAKQIAAGNWLGKYHSLTLAVVPGYAVFLALSMVSRVPYLWLLAGCNVIAVSFLLRKSGYLFGKARALSLILGIMLLFNPIIAAFVRIYRFQLPAVCYPVFVGSLISLFNPDDRRQHWAAETADACIVFAAWGFLWFSREENLLYVGCLTVALLAFVAAKNSLASPRRNLRFVLYGMTGVAVFWLVICSLNSKHYGRFIVCEKTSAPYTAVIKTFHRIADPDFPRYAAGSGSSPQKILRIAEAVPLFKPLAEQLIAKGASWGKLPLQFVPKHRKVVANHAYARATYLDRNSLEFAQLPYPALTISHFEWAWSDAAEAAGYYSNNAASLAAYYANLDAALKKAINDGRLAARNDILAQIGPYFLAKNDLAIIPRLFVKYYFYFFPTPGNAASFRHDLMAQYSKHAMAGKADREKWTKALKIKYIDPNDKQLRDKEVKAFANQF